MNNSRTFCWISALILMFCSHFLFADDSMFCWGMVGGLLIGNVIRHWIFRD